MKTESIQEYKLKIKNDFSYELKDQKDNICTFSKPATVKGIAKLYTVTENKKLLYVGIAKQSMSARLNNGLKAKGKSGYHGYKWKHIRSSLTFRVWTIKERDNYISLSEIETIEAEVAYLCRNKSGQWPKNQSEIHFQQSTLVHRKIAEIIYSKTIS